MSFLVTKTYCTSIFYFFFGVGMHRISRQKCIFPSYLIIVADEASIIMLRSCFFFFFFLIEIEGFRPCEVSKLLQLLLLLLFIFQSVLLQKDFGQYTMV